MDNGTKASLPVQEGSITSEIINLSSAITAAEDLVELLTNKLAPLLVDHSATEQRDNSVPSPSRSMLASGLSELSSRQIGVNSRLNYLIESLGL